MSIISDSINEKSAGKMLADARFYRNLSLDKVAKDLHIDNMLLYDVELDNFSNFNDISSAIAFIDKICEFYQIDSYPIVESFSINYQKDPENVKITDTVLDLKIQNSFEVEVELVKKESEKNASPIEELQPSSKIEPIFLNLDFNSENECVEKKSVKNDLEKSLPNSEDKIESINIKNEKKEHKKLTKSNGTFGEILKNGRIEKKYSILNIAEITRIPHTYIECFENNNFDRFPAPVYTKSYIKKLAEKYELNSDQLLDLYENRDTKIEENFKNQNENKINDMTKNQKIAFNTSSFLPPMSNVSVKKNSANKLVKITAIILILTITILVIKKSGESIVDMKSSKVEKIEQNLNKSILSSENENLGALISFQDLVQFIEKPIPVPQKLDIPQNQN